MIPRLVLLRTLIVLALTQLIGWGSVGLIAIVGRQMADDLGMDLTAVFAGNSILYLVMGLCAPLLAKSFAGFGARLVMIGGTAVAGLGFAVLALSEGPVMYVLAWVILGIAGSATLTTPAFILLNEVVRPNARSAISALMLVTGLSSSLFWPIASFSVSGCRLANYLPDLRRVDGPAVPAIVDHLCQDDFAYRAAAQRDVGLVTARSCRRSHPFWQQRCAGARDPMFVQRARDTVYPQSSPPEASASLISRWGQPTQ